MAALWLIGSVSMSNTSSTEGTVRCSPGAIEALASAGSELPAPGPALPWAEGSPYMVARLLNMSAGLELPAGCCIWGTEVPAAPAAPLCSMSRFACCICIQGRTLSQPDSMLCWACENAAAYHEPGKKAKDTAWVLAAGKHMKPNASTSGIQAPRLKACWFKQDSACQGSLL